MKQIDLHVHSNKSDGSTPPAKLVELAMQKGLSAFALTDHDTVDGIDEALDAARALRAQGKTNVPEVIPGIELSTEYHGKDVHLVGLFIDHHSAAFQTYLQEFVKARTERNYKMCDSLRGAGIDITYERLLEAFPDCVLTRAHYAMYLLNHGYCSSVKDAFDRYVGDHAPHFIPREKITPSMAVQLILQAGGVPILAHPVLYRMSDAHLEALVKKLKTAGLVGIEAIYATYTAAEERDMRKLANKYGLLISGGSDFHGEAKPKLELGNGFGRLFVPEDLLEKIRGTVSHIL